MISDHLRSSAFVDPDLQRGPRGPGNRVEIKFTGNVLECCPTKFCWLKFQKINQKALKSETFKQAIVQLLMPRISNKCRPVQNLFLRTNFLLFVYVTCIVPAYRWVNTRREVGFPVISTFGISLVLRPKEFYWVSVCKTQTIGKPLNCQGQIYQTHTSSLQCAYSKHYSSWWFTTIKNVNDHN